MGGIIAFMSDVLGLIDEALPDPRWSARQVSIESIGPRMSSRTCPGQVSSIQSMRARCGELSLELYVGVRAGAPGREPRPCAPHARD